MIKSSWTLTALAALSAVAVLGVAPADAAEKDGKALFTQLKCNSCHVVTSLGIEQIKDPEEEADEDAPKPKDLSDVGSTRDAKWLKGWLEKKIEVEGKTHRKKFPGEPSDLATIVDWLATLKKK